MINELEKQKEKDVVANIELVVVLVMVITSSILLTEVVLKYFNF